MESLSNKKACIAGGSGFLGQRLSTFLIEKGYSVEILPRSVYQNDSDLLAEKINDADAVINLAGASIAKRWTKSYIKEIEKSRMRSTRTIVEAIQKSHIKPRLLLSTSASGIYKDSDRVHDESSTDFADDFLGNLSKNWEAEAQKASAETRVAIMRLGVILGKDGGVIKRLKPLFKMMLGGRIGNGRQAFPYIHIDDVCNAALHIMTSEKSSGVYNFLSPELIDNRDFTKAFAKACKRKAVFIIPKFAVQLVFGKGASFILGGQKLIPRRLILEGFEFKYPNISSALDKLCH
ncbi:MAG: TIGR01777 family oxidoreductase [Bacteroidales bacterium]|nr:TIGR01777 family oxidoreductase [Bacteroidales bacterium]